MTDGSATKVLYIYTPALRSNLRNTILHTSHFTPNSKFLNFNCSLICS